jgi:hypothetical protein
VCDDEDASCAFMPATILLCVAPALLSCLQPPDCDPALGECGSWVVYPYFVL